MLHEARAQERIVRRVLKQPPHEIRHAGHELAVGHIDPQPPASPDDGHLFRITHAVEHLHLDRATVEPEVLRHGHAVREGAQVVAAERGPQHVGMLEKIPHGRLEAGVGPPFLLPHGHRPAGRAGVDRFRIPIRALHEPDPHGRAPLPRPRRQILEVAGRLAQIRLHDDPAIRPVTKLLFGRELLEDREREVLRGMVLHVDVHLRSVGAGQPPQRPQPGEHAVGRAAGVERVELAVERRELDRHVHPREGPVGAVVDERIMGPAGGLRRQFLEEPRVGGGVGVGFGVARDRFAEEVEREASVVPPLRERRGRGLCGCRSRDEPPGLSERGGPHGSGGERGEHAAAGRLEPEPECRGQPFQNGVVEILAHVPVEGRGVVEHRHAVDEPEQAHLEVVVERRQFPGLLGPPLGRHGRRLGGECLGEELLPDRLRAGLDRLSVGGRKPRGQRESRFHVTRHDKPSLKVPGSPLRHGKTNRPSCEARSAREENSGRHPHTPSLYARWL